MKVLHVGCGGESMPDFLEGYEEIRLDVDSSCNPDIVANLLELKDIGQYDAVYGSHVLEHFSQDDVDTVLSEMRRILNPGGIVVMVVPDLTWARPTTEVLYKSPYGPITGLDMFYGHQELIKSNPYMAHKIAFTRDTLGEFLGKHFEKVNVRAFSMYNLIGVGMKI